MLIFRVEFCRNDWVDGEEGSDVYVINWLVFVNVIYYFVCVRMCFYFDFGMVDIVFLVWWNFGNVIVD